MPFEIFKDVGVRTKEYISITENKAFGLPRAFIGKQNITSQHKAILLYDRENQKIALHFTLADAKYGLKVRIPNDTQGGVIVANSFFDIKNIDTSKYSGRYDNFEKVPLRILGINSEGDAYVIQLKEKEFTKEPDTTDTDNTSEDEGKINLGDIPF